MMEVSVLPPPRACQAAKHLAICLLTFLAWAWGVSFASAANPQANTEDRRALAKNDAATPPASRLPVPSPLPSQARELIAAAMVCTAQGNLEAALELYRRAAQAEPETGIPALGRFLRLAGTEAQRREFARDLEERCARGAIPAHVRARGLAALGDSDSALAILRGGNKANEPVAGGARAAANTTETLMQARLLRAHGQAALGEALLARALICGENRPDLEQAELFEALMAPPPVSLYDQPATLVRAMDAGLCAWAAARERTRAEALRLTDPALMRMQSSAEYRSRRNTLLETAKHEGGLGAAWFAARLLAREEKPREAADLLASSSAGKAERGLSLRPIVAEELAEALLALGERTKAIALLDEAASGHSGRYAESLRLRAATLALASRDYAEARQRLEHLHPAAFTSADSQQARAFWCASLSEASRAGDIPRVIDLYTSATQSIPMRDLDYCHEAIFGAMQETAQHRALMQALDERLARQNDKAAAPSSNTAALWRLAAETAGQLRDPRARIEALARWAQANEGNFEALEVLANAVLPAAIDLAKASAAERAALSTKDAEGAGEIEPIESLAENTLKTMIRTRPYDPTYLGALIRLRQARGDLEEAARVPDIALGNSQNTKNPRLLGAAGYALAINGFPAAAMEYYDRALALDPRDMSIRMNRASCLTRLDRFDEAAQFYREVLEKGVNGRAYHVHEVVGRLWKIEEHQGRAAECIEYFRSLGQRIQGGWAAEAWRDMARLMAREKHFAEAREFFRRWEAQADSPEMRRQAAQEALDTYMEAQDYAQAESEARAAAQRLRGDPEGVAMALRAQAEALAKLNRKREAAALLDDWVACNPELPAAWDAVFRAAQLAEESGDATMALNLYNKFLNSPSLDFAGRRAAEEFCAGHAPSEPAK